MRGIFYSLILMSSFVIGQTYCAGDQISAADLNATHEVCYGHGDYEVGDSWSLGDYDGSTNGGNYHILFIDLSATW